MIQCNKIYLLLFTGLCLVSIVYGQQAKTANEIIDPVTSLSGTGGGGITDSAKAPYAPFVVRNIIITGNRKTKDQIILREIPFKEGDHYQLQALVEKFVDAQQQLMNTGLFHEAVVALKSFENYNVDISITLKERWYIFPIPYFNIVARNFNEWINDHGASLDRVNYGLKLVHNNTTGRKDKLKFSITNGYTKQLGLRYSRPYFDKSMKWGFNVGVNTGKNRDITYNVINNKQEILNLENEHIHSFFRSFAEITYRRAIKTTHRFGIGYTHERVSDTVVALNPDFFNKGNNNVSFPEIYYALSYFDLDYIPYPLQGYAADVMVSKKGFNSDISMWQATVKGSGTWPVAKKTYFNTRLVGSIKLPFDQPFYNQRFLGFNDMGLQGYEMYVIDGVAGGYGKFTLGHELFNFNIKLPRIKYTKLNSIPFRIYGKVYGNAGYVYHPNPQPNSFSNKTLYSGGFGIDIVTIYDFVIKLEYSFNPIGQNGLYLHRMNQF